MVCAILVLTVQVGGYLFRGDDILNNILVDAAGFYEVPHAHGYKEVPRHVWRRTAAINIIHIWFGNFGGDNSLLAASPPMLAKKLRLMNELYTAVSVVYVNL